MNALAALIDRSRRAPEDWRYTDVEKLLAKPAANLVALNSDTCALLGVSRDEQAPCIVFAGGTWQQSQTRFGDLPATILSGNEADGYRLSFAAQNCLVTAPVELVFFGGAEAARDFRLAIDIGANTSVTIIEHHMGAGTKPQIMQADITLGAQAKLMHQKIMQDGGAAHFARTAVRVEGGAYYNNFALMKNTRLMRNEIDVTLAGPLAQCGLYGAMLLQAHEHVDVLTRVHHAAPHGTSRQLYKAVVKDQARGVFQGRVKVAEGAQKADGQQLCRALLLSDQAEMDAKPELEIYADDVACSHGCAIGDLDADAMFYLRSRGLSEGAARALLLRAFVDEVIDVIQVEDIRAPMRAAAEGWMHEQS